MIALPSLFFPLPFPFFPFSLLFHVSPPPQKKKPSLFLFQKRFGFSFVFPEWERRGKFFFLFFFLVPEKIGGSRVVLANWV